MSLVMMSSQQGAVRSPLRHWSIPSVSPPTSRLDLPLDFYVTIKTRPSVIQINLSVFLKKMMNLPGGGKHGTLINKKKIEGGG